VENKSRLDTKLLQISRAVESVLVLVSDIASAGAPPYISAPSHQALDGGGRRIQGGPDIEVKDGLASRFWRTRVVINYVSDFLGT
jgi:hypothetical protein